MAGSKIIVLPRRNFHCLLPIRFGFTTINDSRIVYNGSYPPDAFEKWGQENITPFIVPGGTDSTKPFSDLP